VSEARRKGCQRSAPLAAAKQCETGAQHHATAEPALDLTLLELLNSADSPWSVGAAPSAERAAVFLRDPIGAAVEAPHALLAQLTDIPRVDTPQAHTRDALCDGSALDDRESCDDVAPASCSSSAGTESELAEGSAGFGKLPENAGALEVKPTVGVVAKAVQEALVVRCTESTTLSSAVPRGVLEVHTLDGTQCTLSSVAAADQRARVEVLHAEMLADLHCKRKAAPASQPQSPSGSDETAMAGSTAPVPGRATVTVPAVRGHERATEHRSQTGAASADRSVPQSAASLLGPIPDASRSLCADLPVPAPVEQLPGRPRCAHQTQLLKLLRTDSTVIRQRMTNSE
jgi:hypothetical protein